jgi:hypothetical protein
LLQAYQKTVVSWNIRADVYNGPQHFTDNAAKDPSDELRTKLTEHMETMQLMDGSTVQIDLTVKARLFEPDVEYKIHCVPRARHIQVTYLCTAISPGTVLLSSDVRIDGDDGQMYIENWGLVPVTFTLQTRNLADSIIKHGASWWDSLATGLDTWLHDDGEQETLVALLTRMKAEEQEERAEFARQNQADDAANAEALAALLRMHGPRADDEPESDDSES